MAAIIVLLQSYDLLTLRFAFQDVEFQRHVMFSAHHEPVIQSIARSARGLGIAHLSYGNVLIFLGCDRWSVW